MIRGTPNMIIEWCETSNKIRYIHKLFRKGYKMIDLSTNTN